VTEAQYQQVFNRVAPNRQLDPGVLYHAAGPSESGWCVMEIWNSQESLDRFYQEKLGAALQEANLTGEMTVFQLSNEVKP
jgi:hypothetical protein